MDKLNVPWELGPFQRFVQMQWRILQQEVLQVVIVSVMGRQGILRGFVEVAAAELDWGEVKWGILDSRKPAKESKPVTCWCASIAVTPSQPKSKCCGTIPTRVKRNARPNVSTSLQELILPIRRGWPWGASWWRAQWKSRSPTAGHGHCISSALLAPTWGYRGKIDRYLCKPNAPSLQQHYLIHLVFYSRGSSD